MKLVKNKNCQSSIGKTFFSQEFADYRSRSYYDCLVGMWYTVAKYLKLVINYNF